MAETLLTLPLTGTIATGQMILDDVIVPKWYAEQMEYLVKLKDPCIGHIGPAYDIINLGYVEADKF